MRKQKVEKNGNGKLEGAIHVGVGEGRELAPTEFQVLIAYLVQTASLATVAKIHDKAIEVGAICTRNDVKRACEALRARGHCVIAHERENDETVVQAYKMARVRWPKPLEVAQTTALISKLFETAEALELKHELDGLLAAGGEEKPTDRQKYKDFVEFRLQVRTGTELLGGTPTSPMERMLREKSPFRVLGEDNKPADEHINCFFNRDDDGSLLIRADNVLGSLGRTIYQYGLSDALCSYCSCEPVKIKPQKPLLQRGNPIQDDLQGGKGIGTYEALQPGEEFVIVLTVPTRIFKRDITAEWLTIFRRWLAQPVRSISPAKGRATGGAAEVLNVTSTPLSFKDIEE